MPDGSPAGSISWSARSSAPARVPPKHVLTKHVPSEVGGTGGGCVDIDKSQHRAEAIRCRRVEADRSFELRRIAEGAEQHVPDRQVAVIEGVHIALVVD